MSKVGKFSEVKPGDVFSFIGSMHIKTCSMQCDHVYFQVNSRLIGKKANAYNLFTNKFIYIEDDTTVVIHEDDTMFLSHVLEDVGVH